MKRLFSSVVVGAVALSGVSLSSDAEACGGCFPPPDAEPSQVIGHRMIVSISNEKTTLWDQITYDGNPESFAWVLPIHGQVDIALSSDALFGQLESVSTVRVWAPPPECADDGCPPDPNTTITTTSGTGSGGVRIIAQETVGPYETVQLKSSDPLALESWLELHGYPIPDDIVPIISAYVDEGLDFLAMKLVPGQGVSSMRPVRITSQGAGFTLPLRMVAAGTGEITPITLWIASEGRYEPTNFPWFTIGGEELTFDWDTWTSDYATVKQAHFDQNGGAWLVETAEPTWTGFIGSLQQSVEFFPEESGYTPEIAGEECAADLDALYGTLDAQQFWLTRIHARLPRAELSKDLMLGASATQTEVPTLLKAQNTIGSYPCPTPCNTSGSGGDGGGGNGSGANGSGANGSGANGAGLWTPGGDGGSGANNEDGGSSEGGSGGCSMGGSATAFGAVLAALGMAAALRRRRRSRSSQA